MHNGLDKAVEFLRCQLFGVELKTGCPVVATVRCLLTRLGRVSGEQGCRTRAGRQCPELGGVRSSEK